MSWHSPRLIVRLLSESNCDETGTKNPSNTGRVPINRRCRIVLVDFSYVILSGPIKKGPAPPIALVPMLADAI
jgi:hypothetical protein